MTTADELAFPFAPGKWAEFRQQVAAKVRAGQQVTCVSCGKGLVTAMHNARGRAMVRCVGCGEIYERS